MAEPIVTDTVTTPSASTQTTTTSIPVMDAPTRSARVSAEFSGRTFETDGKEGKGEDIDHEGLIKALKAIDINGRIVSAFAIAYFSNNYPLPHNLPLLPSHGSTILLSDDDIKYYNDEKLLMEIHDCINKFIVSSYWQINFTDVPGAYTFINGANSTLCNESTLYG